MPIQFAPPDLIDASVFAGLGRQEATQRQAELAARREAATLAAFNDNQRIAVASGAQRADAGNMQAQLEQRQFEFQEAARQRERLAQLESQTQLAAIDRRGQVQAFLQTLDPGFAEEQQYQRDLDQISRIQADPTMKQFEKDNIIYNRMFGVKLTEQRLKEARAKHESAIADQEIQYARRQAGIADETARRAASSLEQRTFRLPDGGSLVETRDGKTLHIPAPKPEKPPPMMSMADMRHEAESFAPDDVYNEEKGTMHASPDRLRARNEYFQKILARERAKQQQAAPGVQAPVGEQQGQGQPQLTDLPPIRPGAEPLPQQKVQVQEIRKLAEDAKALPRDIALVALSRVANLNEIVAQGMPSSRKDEFDAIYLDLLSLMQNKKKPEYVEPEPKGESEFKKALRRPLMPGR